MSETYILKMFVMGKSARLEREIDNLKQICANQLNDRYRLRVIDVLENPQLAEDEKILATPTLVRELPPPMRRIIGDLSNIEKVLIGLGLDLVLP